MKVGRGLVGGAEAGGVGSGGGFGFEAVEAPDECNAEIARHVVYFHPKVLALAIVGAGIEIVGAGITFLWVWIVVVGIGFDCQGWRPAVEEIVSLHVKLATSLFPELPF